MVSALPSSNWTVMTVSGAARASAGAANRQPMASATAAATRGCRPRILVHLLMDYSLGRSESGMLTPLFSYELFLTNQGVSRSLERARRLPDLRRSASGRGHHRRPRSG